MNVFVSYLLHIGILVALALPIHALPAQITFDGPTTPGQPWTYVPYDLVPEEANDTAYRNELFRYFDVPPGRVRKVFNVYIHPELLPSPRDTSMISAQIVYDDNFVRTITWGRYRTDTIRLSPISSGFNYYGTGSVDSGVIGFATFRFNWSRDLDPDTGEFSFGYFSSISGSPGSYYVFDGPLVNGHRRWGYFLQFVNAVHHPAITALAELPTGRLATAPWPNPCRNSLQITPAPGSGHVGVSVVDALGREVYRREAGDQWGALGTTSITLDDAAFGALAPGFYHVVVQRHGLGAQVAPFVKGE